MIRAWRLLFFCGFLSLTLGHEGRGVFLRIKKKYLEEKLAKCLVESNLGEELTHLISARNPEPRHGTGRFFFGYLENLSPRLKVETPYLPAVEIAMRSNDSFNIRLSVQFGIYFEYKDVEIQVTKNFSAVANGSSDGFRLQSCHSCAGISHIKTWYKTVKALKEGVTPMVKTSLDKNLVPVLDANACDLLLSSLSDSDGFLLSLQDLVDLSPAGIQYSLQSFQMQDDVLILELGLSAGEGAADGRAEDRIADLLKSLPSMQDGAVADVAMTKNQLEQNFNQLLYPFEPFIVDKDHRMGYCLLESVLPVLPGDVSYDELNDYLVNVTARGPPKFHGAHGSFYVIHPLKMEVFNTKEMEVAVWTLTDAYCLPADIFITDNKLKLSLTLDSGFLDMEGENRAKLHRGAYEAVEMLEKVLNQESPFPMLDYLQQELPLPLVPDIGEVMKMEDMSYDEYLLVSIIAK